MISTPSESSLAFRANLAALVSPLKRVRPRVPFYKLAAHRIPTLWCLYRGLLRAASGSCNTKFRIAMLFRQYRHLTSPAATREKLLQGYKVTLFHQTISRQLMCRSGWNIFKKQKRVTKDSFQ